MQVKFYANMRTVMRRSTLEISDNAVNTFRTLIHHLVDRYPDSAFHLLDEQGELRKDVPVYVDGRNPRLAPGGIDTPLNPDSIVSFFSPISSGRMNVEVLREPTYGKGAIDES